MANPQTSFRLTSFQNTSFLARRRAVVQSATLKYQLDVLKKTGRYDAFRLKWHPTYNDEPDVWPVPNHLFWDSDVAKWIEGACYFLQQGENSDISGAVEELVDMIRGAQQPDGYLNIHFTVVEPGKRFTNLRDLHELYNAGHLIEAALAHQEYFGNDLLLQPILAYVKLLCKTFGPGESQMHGYPGHPEIELALVRLFQRVQDPEILDLARYFLQERGNPTGADGNHYYDVEAKKRGERENERPFYYPVKKSYWYQQAHLPIVEQESIEGHSVRAMYLLTALADLIRIDKDSLSSDYNDALHRLWKSMVYKKMYLTGAIGAIKQWEGFGIDYFLPQGTDEGGCYGETCAAIGVVMLAERMLQIDLDGKYADIMELCLYNSVLTGMSLDGTKFTYVNQMASSNKDLSKRQDWFTCACCPPNVTRLLGYIGGCLWTVKQEPGFRSVSLDVHIYESATIEIPVQGDTIVVSLESGWPWTGYAKFSIKCPKSIDLTIRLRIPSWASTWEFSPSNGTAHLQKGGYLTLAPSWLKETSEFELKIPFDARYIAPHPNTNQDIIAIARGPLVYCLEDFDNPWVEDHFKSIYLDTSANLVEKAKMDEETEEQYIEIVADSGAYTQKTLDNSASSEMPGQPVSALEPLHRNLTFVPYYFRANRGGKGQMRVGLHRFANHVKG